MRIAHVSDLHLLDDAPPRGLRRRYLSFFRRQDALTRRANALAAFRAARARADHLVVTGDLTEEGTAAQFEVLGEVLAESGWSGDRVTLLPGNHDRYGEADAFERALDGPLHAWRAGSRAGAPVEREGAVVVPLDSSVPQTWLKSSGRVDLERLPHIDRLRAQAGGRAVVLAVHHPPYRVRTHAVHGLLNFAALHAHLERHAELHLLHGHLHTRVDRAVGGGDPRVHAVHAATEDPAAVRVYAARDGRLHDVDAPAA